MAVHVNDLVVAKLKDFSQEGEKNELLTRG